jgi:hypothetical protein
VNYSKKGKKMRRVEKEPRQPYVWVEKFDEEDWKELLRHDLWKPSEQDKAKLRVD